MSDTAQAWRLKPSSWRRINDALPAANNNLTESIRDTRFIPDQFSDSSPRDELNVMPELSRTVQPAPHTGHAFPLRVSDRHIANVCLGLFLVTLWPLTHRYKGLAGDAGLYAVQALAKIHSNLAGDLFLQNISQDSYTVFPLLYAWCIRWLGLPTAAMTLVTALKIWFFAAAWAVARELFDRRSAFLSTVTVMVIAGSYGGYSVFNFSEDWLTARTLAEPMVITALWLYCRNLKTGAFLVAFAAFFVHPLMTLPGLALLLLLWLPLTIGAAGAVLGVATTLGAALLALHQPPDLGPLSIMDADWLEMVRERSVFLLPQFWSASDWQMNALPFVSLTISAIVLRDPRIQKLSIAVALVGVTGLAIALVAATIGPVGLFLQGQAWRWVWITRFTAVILLAPTLLNLWREEKCGPLCVALTVFGWTFSPIEGLACLTIALMFRSAGHHVTHRAAGYLRWTAIALAGVLVARVVAQSWSIVSSLAPVSDLEPVLVTNIRNILGLWVISMALAWSLLYWLESTTSRALPASLSLALLICCMLLYPGAFRVHMREGNSEQISEFSDWRGSIAPDDTVFVVPAHNSATFAWLTLERPSYLTVDQSAGVVFSRATALEVRRRSDVLSPLMDPDWKLLSEKASSGPSGGATGKKGVKPLTRDSLIEICRDPKLRFVVARENLGFDSITHTHDGNWKDWSLYDCRRVHSGVPLA
jgi:hypothetical protein